jgi:hypothetical protein
VAEIAQCAIRAGDEIELLRPRALRAGACWGHDEFGASCACSPRGST